MSEGYEVPTELPGSVHSLIMFFFPVMRGGWRGGDLEESSLTIYINSASFPLDVQCSFLKTPSYNVQYWFTETFFGLACDFSLP